MARRNEVKCRLFSLATIYLLFFSIPAVIPLGGSALTYPSDPATITHIEYEYTHKFTHRSLNPVVTGGNIVINMKNDSDSNYAVKSVYDITISYCENGVTSFDGSINYTIDSDTRFIRDGISGIGVSPEYPKGKMNPEGQFSNLFLSKSFLEEGYSTRFWMDDLTIIKGLVWGWYFNYSGIMNINIGNKLVECYRISLDQTFINPDYVCGLGAVVMMECNFEYFYEKQSGLLVYTNTFIYEYVKDDKSLYRTHEISRIITDLKYKGQPIGDLSQFFDLVLQGDPDVLKGVFGIIAIVSITTVILLRLNKTKQKRDAQEYIRLKEQEAFGTIKRNIDEIEDP